MPLESFCLLPIQLISLRSLSPFPSPLLPSSVPEKDELANRHFFLSRVLFSPVLQFRNVSSPLLPRSNQQRCSNQRRQGYNGLFTSAN